MATNSQPIPNLDELIKNKIDGELIEQNISPLLQPGENYSTEVYKVDFKIKKKNGKIETYNAVAKCTPSNKTTQILMRTQVTFKSEIAWYTTVIPTLKNFVAENGIDLDMNYFQNFYGGRISLDPQSDVVDENGVMLTQNLLALGYKMVDRLVGFDLKTSKVILRKLATFHVIPIAIKLKNRPLFDKNIRPYLPNMDLKSTIIKNLNKRHLMSVYESLENDEELTPYLEKFRKQIEHSAPFINESTIIKEPWGSISHNDFWINNIMLKNVDGNEEDIDIIILDLQFPCYGSIALDLVFFLTISVAQNVVETEMDNLIQYYWEQFVYNLKKCSIDTSLFPYEEFQQEIIDAAGGSQFLHAITLIRYVLADQGKTVWNSSDSNCKMEDLKVSQLNSNNIQRNKYIWILKEYVKRNWI